jgi:hypothetical protein
MSKSNAFETDFLGLIFTATTIPLVASGIAGSLWLSLHFADPGEAGNQASSESDYLNYARQSVARTTAGWTVAGSAVTLTSSVSFPASSTVASTLTHFGIGTVSAGSTSMLFSGTITPSITVNTNVTPRLTTGTNVTED